MAQQARKLSTIDDLLALPNEERAELIEGEIVRKSAPSAEHSFAQRNITVALDPFHRPIIADAIHGQKTRLEHLR